MSDDPTYQRRRGIALSLAAAVFAAAFLVCYKAASRAAPTHVVVLSMLGCAAIFNLAVTAVERLRGAAERRPMDRTAWRTTLLLAFLTVLGNLGMSKALSYLDAGMTSTLVQSQIFFVALGSWLFLRERLSARYIIGTAIAIAGVVSMRIPIGASPQVNLLGLAWVMLVAVSFSAMLVATRAVVQKVPLILVNALRLIIATLCLALIPGADAIANLSLDTLLWIIGAAAAGPFISRLCLMFSVRDISAAHSKLVTLTAPVFAFALGFAVFHTVPTLRELVGSALILAGVILPVVELAQEA